MFEPLFEDVFTRDDARVRELLAQLRGDVLDLGCGEGPYADILAPLASSGQIRYLGVDPDAGAIARLRERWPWAQLHVGDGEQLELDERSFDHVLILRSWNHLREPERVLARLLPRIRAGGTITIVDNVAFGLARTHGQTQRAERSRAAFEHYRNDTLADAAAVLGDFTAAFGLIELSRLEVGPHTSNQWLLHVRVDGGAAL
jgi:SAM-dependent methyltransferase